MAWTEQWDIFIDGTNINDVTNYYTSIPEISNVFTQEVVLVEMANDYPRYVRMQPTSGKLTFLIQIIPGDWASFNTRVTALKALFTPGPHVLAVQVRGMPDVKTMNIIVEGFAIDDVKTRRATASAIAPTPILV